MIDKFGNRVCIGIVIFIALVVRLWGLSEVGLWHDEAVAHFYAMSEPTWILKHSAGAMNHPPLFFLILHAWLSLVPPFHTIAVELLNAVIGTLTVGVAFLWHWHWKQPWTFLGGLFLALNPFHIYYSGELRMYALATFALLVAGYFSAKILENPGPIDYLGWGLAAVVAIYTHSFTLIPVVLMALYIGWTCWGGPQGKEYAFTVGAVALLYAPWSVVVFNQTRRIMQNYWIPEFQFGYLGNLFLWIGGWIGPRRLDPLNLVLVPLIILAVLIPLGLSLSLRTDPKIALLWFVSAGTLLTVIGVSLLGQSAFLYRTFVVLVPFFLILVARGMALYPRTIAVMICVLYVAGMGVEVARLKANPPHQYAKQVAGWIDQEYRESDVIVHAHGFSFYPSYFYHQRSYPEYLLGSGVGKNIRITEDGFNRLRGQSNILFVRDLSQAQEPPNIRKRAGKSLGIQEWSGRSYELIRLPKLDRNL